jgi:hypothetical protein
MGAYRWAGLALATCLALACDNQPAGIQAACVHFCECQGVVLPSQQRTCTASCEAELVGVAVSQALLDCYVAASCVELLTSDVCDLEDDDDGSGFADAGPDASAF